MAKTISLRKFLLSCFYTSTNGTTPTTTAVKKRISTSLRDDIPDEPCNMSTQEPLEDEDDQDSDIFSGLKAISTNTVNPRPSKTMVIGTIFGQRKGHVWFCIQHDRLSIKPTLLLEMSVPTHQLVKEMSCGLVRIALECIGNEEMSSSCPLRAVPVWSLFCNGRKLGFAVRRKASEQTRVMLKNMQAISVGAGVIPTLESEEIMYMRANYEHVVGSLDSESFHLINPDGCPGQELSVFLMRSR